MSLQPTPPAKSGRNGALRVEEPFRIAGRLVEPSLHRITGPEGGASVEPKLMQVLLCLARSPGSVVSKEDILREVWNGTFVTDDVLTRAIGELRKVFGDSAAAPRVIETIRKSGYRLIAPVLPASPGSPDTDEKNLAARPPAVGRRRRIGAVLIGAALVLLAAGVMLLSRRPAPAGPVRIRPLTSSPGNERDPAVSPDGTRVAYAWNGGEGERYSLYVKLLDGGAALRLTGEKGAEDRAPAWSPDGQRIAFTRATESGCEMLVVASLGGGERRLAPCGDKEYRRLAWSPDGRWLAVPRRNASSQLFLELVSLETRERRAITHPPPQILGDTSPAFSPDGATLAFSRNISDGTGDLYRVSVSGGEPQRLTFDNRDTFGLDWSSDGKSVLFSSSRAGIYSLWRVPASGGEPTWLAGGGTKMKHPSSARAKNVIAFENWTYEVNLWRAPSGSGRTLPADAPRRLTQTADQWNFDPHVSPDGTRIAFVSTRSGSEEIWLEGADGEKPTPLTAFDGARLETPRWSPDGKRLVFSVRLKGWANLYTVDATGGSVERLTSEAADAVAPSWSRDGRSIYFASRRGGSWQIWKLGLSGRSLTGVTLEGGYSSRESPDGRWLYFTRADVPGIWRQPVEGGPASRIVDSLAPEDWANWEIGAAGLYFRELCAAHRDPALVFLPFGENAPRHVAELTEQVWPGFSVAGDGSWIVYPRADRHSCEIRLIENAP
jgi:Tol biopolymer transport system component/DNA-binding winged helix-turn-helix (wHTH) protein